MYIESVDSMHRCTPFSVSIHCLDCSLIRVHFANRPVQPHLDCCNTKSIFAFNVEVHYDWINSVHATVSNVIHGKSNQQQQNMRLLVM